MRAGCIISISLICWKLLSGQQLQLAGTLVDSASGKGIPGVTVHCSIGGEDLTGGTSYENRRSGSFKILLPSSARVGRFVRVTLSDPHRTITNYIGGAVPILAPGEGPLEIRTAPKASLSVLTDAEILDLLKLAASRYDPGTIRRPGHSFSTEENDYVARLERLTAQVARDFDLPLSQVRQRFNQLLTKPAPTEESRGLVALFKGHPNEAAISFAAAFENEKEKGKEEELRSNTRQAELKILEAHSYLAGAKLISAALAAAAANEISPKDATADAITKLELGHICLLLSKLDGDNIQKDVLGDRPCSGKLWPQILTSALEAQRTASTDDTVETDLMLEIAALVNWSGDGFSSDGFSRDVLIENISQLLTGIALRADYLLKITSADRSSDYPKTLLNLALIKGQGAGVEVDNADRHNARAFEAEQILITAEAALASEPGTSPFTKGQIPLTRGLLSLHRDNGIAIFSRFVSQAESRLLASKSTREASYIDYLGAKNLDRYIEVCRGDRELGGAGCPKDEAGKVAAFGKVEELFGRAIRLALTPDLLSVEASEAAAFRMEFSSWLSKTSGLFGNLHRNQQAVVQIMKALQTVEKTDEAKGVQPYWDVLVQALWVLGNDDSSRPFLTQSEIRDVRRFYSLHSPTQREVKHDEYLSGGKESIFDVADEVLWNLHPIPDKRQPPSVIDGRSATATLVIRTKGGIVIGSGAFIADDGLILTAYHVVQGAVDVSVLSSGKFLQNDHLVIESIDPDHDLATLRTRDLKLKTPYFPTTNGSPNTMDQLRVYGQGGGRCSHPIAVRAKMAGFVRAGTVSREFKLPDVDIIPLNSDFDECMSGAPLVSNGRILGVVLGKLGAQAASWAIPIGYIASKTSKNMGVPASAMQWPPLRLMAQEWPNPRREFSFEGVGESLNELLESSASAYHMAEDAWPQVSELSTIKSALLTAMASVSSADDSLLIEKSRRFMDLIALAEEQLGELMKNDDTDNLDVGKKIRGDLQTWSNALTTISGYLGLPKSPTKERSTYTLLVEMSKEVDEAKDALQASSKSCSVLDQGALETVGDFRTLLGSLGKCTEQRSVAFKKIRDAFPSLGGLVELLLQGNALATSSAKARQ